MLTGNEDESQSKTLDEYLNQMDDKDELGSIIDFKKKKSETSRSKASVINLAKKMD